MKLHWEKEIPENDFGYSNFCCKPIVYNNKLFYAYDVLDKENTNVKGYYGTKIVVSEFMLTNGDYSSKHISFDYDFNYLSDTEKKINLSSEWEFRIAKGKLFLYVGFLLEVFNDTLKVSDPSFRAASKTIKTEFPFNDKQLIYNQRSTIECFNKTTGKQLWKLKVKGFLYTNIEQKGDNIFFGTAGKGGALYCVDLESGNILTEFSNTDSSNYEWIKNDILVKDSKGNMVQLNPLTNKATEIFLLKDKMFYAPILFNEGYVFTTVHCKSKNLAKVICINV